MPSLKMLIGLPASGKSTYSRNLVNSDSSWVHLSSDDIAYEKFPDGQSIDHQQVFQELFLKTCACLENGKNVIYDATNLASKKRKSFLNRIEKFHAHTEAVVFITPYELLQKRNNARESPQRVPPHILNRYIRALQFPRKDEKFDQISVLTDNKRKQTYHSLPIQRAEIQNLIMKEKLSYKEWMGIYALFEETRPFLQLAENHPSHMSTINMQAYQAFQKAIKEIHDPYEQKVMVWTILLHGIGRAYVRKNLPIDEDNFYGYEHASMYTAYPILSSLCFSETFIFDVLLLIDEHIIGHQLKRGKIKRRIGIQNYTRLETFWCLFE